MEAPFCWLCTVFLLCCMHFYLPANYSQFSYLSSKRFPSKSTSRNTVCCPFLGLTVRLSLVLLSLDSQARLTRSQALATEGWWASSTNPLHSAKRRSNATIWASLLPRPWCSTSSTASLVVFVGQTHPCPVAVYTSTWGSHQTHSAAVMSFNQQHIQVSRLRSSSVCPWHRDTQ